MDTAQVLFDVTFSVDAGEVVTLIGRNGMGKTTTIRTLMGLLPARGGIATFDGRSLLGLAAVSHRAGGSRTRPGRTPDISDADASRKISSRPPPSRFGAAALDAESHLRAVSRARANVAATWAISYRAASSRCSPSAAR